MYIFTAAIVWLSLSIPILSAAIASAAPASIPPDTPAFHDRHSPVIGGVTWHWETYKTAAPGSDLWPVTWAADDNLYTSWGDGGGFGGTDSDGRVAMGFARIEGPPTDFRAVNVNGGKNPEHPASFPTQGKTGSMIAIGNTLYAWMNCQDHPWPNVDDQLICSTDLGATWNRTAWVFPRGAGHFKPYHFLLFGRGYTGVPVRLRGFVYFYGPREGDDSVTYMGRVAQDRLRDRSAYQFLQGFTAAGSPIWSAELDHLWPVFSDSAGTLGGVTYDPPLKRYLSAGYFEGPGQLRIYDSPAPWGPWTTVARYEDFGQMGSAGEGLECSFPQKWLSRDGRTAWCIFSAYGPGAKLGIKAHDRFNLVEVTLEKPVKPRRGGG